MLSKMIDVTQKTNIINQAGSTQALTQNNVEDIWLFNTSNAIYDYIPYANINEPQGEDIYISSSDDNDDQNVIIFGLDGNGRYQEEIIQIEGQVKKQLQNQFFRIFKAYALDPVSPTGTVYIYRNVTVTVGVPTDLTKVQAFIINGVNTSRMSHFTIPWNMSGELKNYTYSHNAQAVDQNMIFTYLLREPGGAFTPKFTFNPNVSGQGVYSKEFEKNEKYIPGTDIVWRVKTPLTTGLASVDYTLELTELI